MIVPFFRGGGGGVIFVYLYNYIRTLFLGSFYLQSESFRSTAPDCSDDIWRKILYAHADISKKDRCRRAREQKGCDYETTDVVSTQKFLKLVLSIYHLFQ